VALDHLETPSPEAGIRSVVSALGRRIWEERYDGGRLQRAE
jgi:hypothetical protein